jgi:hypothetical protein
MNEHAKRNAANTAVAAGLSLFYGWFYATIGISDDAFYNFTVSCLFWTLRIGGLLLLIAAAICFLGRRGGLLLDAVFSGCIAVVMVLCAAYWMKADGFNSQNIIIFVFGILFGRAAWFSWGSFSLGDSTNTSQVIESVEAGSTPHPASIHPDVLPTEDQPAPPDGYLAALSKDPDPPATASHE